MERVLKQMDTELLRTKKKEAWGFAQWPFSSPLFTGDGRSDFSFEVKYQVVNQNGEIIIVDQTAQFSLTAGMIQSDYRVYPDCEQEQSITIKNVNYDINAKKMIGSDLSIEIVNINGIPAEQAGQIGYMRIIPVSSMPPVIKPDYPKNITAEREKQKREIAAAQKEQERALAATRKKEEKTNYTLNNRFGSYATGGIYITGEKDAQVAGSIDIGTEIGLGHWGGEITLRLYPGIRSDGYDPEDSTIHLDGGIVLGVNYAFIGKKWVLNLGGGFSVLMSDTGADSDFNLYFVPHFQAKFDFHLFGIIYARIAYRADLFTGNKFNKGFGYPWPHDIKVVDNIGLGLVRYF
jgi:hypothetical protein